MSPSGEDTRVEESFAAIGATLQIVRVLLGMPQAELAARAGIRPNQVSRYETGQVLPQLTQLGRLLGALELDVVDFFLFFAAVRTWSRVLRLGEETSQGDLGELQDLVRQLTARQVHAQEAVLAAVETLVAERNSGPAAE